MFSNTGILALTLSFLGFSSSVSAVTLGATPGATLAVTSRLTVKVVVRDLEKPFAVVAAPNGDLWITEKPGRIRIYDSSYNLKSTLTVSDGSFPEFSFFGEGGILDVAFHPQFSTQRYVYVAYSVAGPMGHFTRINRFTSVEKNSSVHLQNHKIIFDGPASAAGTHFGCRLAFGPDGLLYASFGERREMHRAQDMTTAHGKIIRIRDDGSIPRGNPFGPSSAIYSLGHRNPQGLAFRPSDGKLLSSEHGPTVYDAPEGGDEVNEIVSGGNYGWPKHHHRETAPGFLAPIAEYTPAVAPSGLQFYSGSRIPEWKGDLFIATLRGRHVLHLKLDSQGRVTKQDKLFSGRFGRLRDVETSARGTLLILSEDGRLVEVDRR